MKKTLLLSDHRTGSTCIKNCIYQNPEIKFLTLEPLFYWKRYNLMQIKKYLYYELDEQPESLENIDIKSIFKDFDLLHIHREHLDTANKEDLIWLSDKKNLNIIDIKRSNIFNQFVSYILALTDHNWVGTDVSIDTQVLKQKQKKVDQLTISKKEYHDFEKKMRDLRNRYDEFFKNHEKIEILYEDFEHSEEELKNIIKKAYNLIGINNHTFKIGKKPNKPKTKILLIEKY